MLDFDYIVPTKIFFGKGKVKIIPEEIRKYSDRILFVYGQGSIKRMGLYEEVVKILHDNLFFFKELSGVQPNPQIKNVRRGIDICRENNLGFILAVGGGSVIDCAKAIAAGFYYQQDPWDFFMKKAEIDKALPLGTVLTLSATGSEMNGFAVISNEQTKDKLPAGSDLLRPAFSVLDPAYTFSVNPLQTAAGIVDIFAHVMEQYFSLEEGAFLQDRMAEAIFKTCIEYGPKAMIRPTDYEARANIMWASSLALNGLLACGKTGDWATHYIEHAVSAMYDVTHGVGLAVLAPYWMEYVLDDARLPKFAAYARCVWGIEGGSDLDAAKKGIAATRQFFTDMGMPVHLRQVMVEEKSLEQMAKKATLFGKIGSFRELDTADVLAILKAAC
jgi:hypothetical protein